MALNSYHNSQSQANQKDHNSVIRGLEGSANKAHAQVDKGRSIARDSSRPLTAQLHLSMLHFFQCRRYAAEGRFPWITS